MKVIFKTVSEFSNLIRRLTKESSPTLKTTSVDRIKILYTWDQLHTFVLIVRFSPLTLNMISQFREGSDPHFIFDPHPLLGIPP